MVAGVQIRRVTQSKSGSEGNKASMIKSVSGQGSCSLMRVCVAILEHLPMRVCAAMLDISAL